MVAANVSEDVKLSRKLSEQRATTQFFRSSAPLSFAASRDKIIIKKPFVGLIIFNGCVVLGSHAGGHGRLTPPPSLAHIRIGGAPACCDPALYHFIEGGSAFSVSNRIAGNAAGSAPLPPLALYLGPCLGGCC